MEVSLSSASVRDKRKRINPEMTNSTEVYNEGDNNRCKSEKTDQLRRIGSSTTVVAGKRRTCKPPADRHSSQKPRVLCQKNNGESPQHHRETRSSRHHTKEVGATKRASTVTVYHNQIRNAANRSNAAIKSASNGNKAESILNRTTNGSDVAIRNATDRSFSSDESERKIESLSSGPDETALLDYPSSEFTDTSSSTVSVSGDGGACDADMAVEETRSDESDVGEGTEEMNMAELNDSDETNSTEIHAEKEPEKEQCVEETVLMCPGEEEEELDDEEEIEVDDKKTEDNSVSNFYIEEESNKNVVELKSPIKEPYKKPGVNRINRASSRSFPVSAIGGSGSNKQPALIKKKYPTLSGPVSNPEYIRPSVTRVSDQRHRTVPQSHSKVQCLVDLVMWRYVPKTALIFGIGIFLIVSSSFATNLEISFVSIISYLGLIYLGVIFLYKSFINKDIASETEQHYHGVGEPMVGEQDVVWALRLILPYVNESLHKLTALFSGDPGTTMKVAAVLFVLARCGGSFTIWKLLKLGFFAAFTVPKLYSSYSTQISGYGKFWVRRFQDAWKSCSQKKAVAFGMCSIVWSFSSVTARIWAGFMLIAAVRYCQQSKVGAEWPEAETEYKNVVNVEKQNSGKQPSVRNGRQIRSAGMKKAM